MKKLITMMAAMMPLEEIISRLEEVIADYKVKQLTGAVDDKSIGAIAIHCQLLLTNIVVTKGGKDSENVFKNSMEFIQSIERTEQASNLLNNKSRLS